MIRERLLRLQDLADVGSVLVAARCCCCPTTTTTTTATRLRRDGDAHVPVVVIAVEDLELLADLGLLARIRVSMAQAVRSGGGGTRPSLPVCCAGLLLLLRRPGRRVGNVGPSGRVGSLGARDLDHPEIVHFWREVKVSRYEGKGRLFYLLVKTKLH